MTTPKQTDREALSGSAGGPLAGVRIVAFTQFLLGPAAAQYLADMGAEVIKIEEPSNGAYERRWAGAESFVNGVSTFFMLAHRNVRSIGLDLKQAKGQEIARRMCRDADVVIANFRPGVMEKLGLGYEALAPENPRLIYAVATGYGADSPYRDLPGQDLLLQSAAGLAAASGDRDGPPVAAGSAVVDQHAASLLAMGVLAALNGRHQTGRGQQLEVTMVEAALDLQAEPLLYHLNGAVVQRPSVPLASSFHEAPYGFYEVTNGHVALSLSPIKRISEALGAPEGLEPFLDPSLAFTHREEIYAALRPLLRGHEKTELIQLFREHGIWCAPVNDYDDLVRDEGVMHLDPFMEIEHPAAGKVTLLKHPIRYRDAPAETRRLPPSLGEHTIEVLLEAGFDCGEILQLQDSGVVNETPNDSHEKERER